MNGDQRLGELIGEVRGLSKAFDQMREENAADHATVMARLDRGEERFDRIDRKLEEKMPKEWGEALHDRLADVEKTKAEGSGRSKLLTWLLGVVVFPIVCAVISGLLILIATGVIS